MAVSASDLIVHSAANRPSNDSSTAGGAIDTASRPSITQFGANAIAQVLSDGADTRTVTVRGRLASGVIDTEALVLNGTTPVSGAKTWERILDVTLSTTNATRTVTVREGAGGTSRVTIGPNETFAHIAFRESVSSGSTELRYEKHFWKNINGTSTLLGALLRLTADSLSRIRVGWAPSQGDSATQTNRKTAPSSVTFVDDGVDQAIPGTDLAAGAACGFYVEQNLPANDPANKGTYTVRLAGTTV